MLTRFAASGRPARPADRLRQRLGVGARLADLARDGVGVVGQVDPAHVRGVGLRHLLRAVAQAHHPGRRPLDHRLGQREEVDPVVVVELRRDVAGQLDVLLLVLAHRHVRGVVEQDVGGHQRRIGEKPERGVLGVLARLVLELDHPVHPADPGDAVEDPGELGMPGHLALREEDRALRVDAAGDIGGGQLARRPAQLLRLLPDGDRVQVDDAVDRLVAVLHGAEAAQRAEIVAERQVARRLDAGEDAAGELGLGHERLPANGTGGHIAAGAGGVNLGAWRRAGPRRACPRWRRPPRRSWPRRARRAAPAPDSA